MRIAVLGTWHLGSVTAACLAASGHAVSVWDADADRVAALARGTAPVTEPGLNDRLSAVLAQGSLVVHQDLADAVRGAEVVWITQDTHVNEDDSIDLTDLELLMGRLGALLEADASVVVSSQVPVGTCRRWWQRLHDDASAAGRSPSGIAYVPENLRLGAALARFDRPDMVVIGSADARTTERVTAALAYTGSPVVRMATESAELVKHAINAFLATSISFANEIASVAEVVGADANDVARAMRLDERIGQKARVAPGLGFAGGTLARDVTTLMDVGRRAGRPSLLAVAVLDVNRRQERWPLERLADAMDLRTSTVCILGLTYTVGTSTLRRSQAVALARALADAGATVRAHDPQANLDELSTPLPMYRATEPYDAAVGCDAVVLMTPWPEYLDLDWSRMSSVMRGTLVVDGPNALDDALVTAHGLAFVGPGRALGSAPHS